MCSNFAMKTLGTLILAFGLAIFCTETLRGQETVGLRPPKPNQVSIGNVEVITGTRKVQVKYQVGFGENIRKCTVNLKVSDDGGQTFQIRPDKTSIKGDVGEITTPGEKEILYDITKDKDKFVDKDVAFKVIVKNAESAEKLRTFALVGLALWGHWDSSSELQGYLNVMAGMCRTFGGYVKVGTNMSFYKNAEVVRSETQAPRSTHDEQYLTVTGGVLFRVTKNIYPYFGLGYGGNNYYITVDKNEVYRIKNKSLNSMAIDAGVAWKMGCFSLSTGISSILFKTWSVSAGIGVAF